MGAPYARRERLGYPRDLMRMAAAPPCKRNHMSRKREVLEHLHRDELLALVDQAGLAVQDKRILKHLIGVLLAMPRVRLKELCRRPERDDSGKKKAQLVDRLLGHTQD